jgi:hypothetical protein
MKAQQLAASVLLLFANDSFGFQSSLHQVHRVGTSQSIVPAFPAMTKKSTRLVQMSDASAADPGAEKKGFFGKVRRSNSSWCRRAVGAE